MIRIIENVLLALTLAYSEPQVLEPPPAFELSEPAGPTLDEEKEEQRLADEKAAAQEKQRIADEAEAKRIAQLSVEQEEITLESQSSTQESAEVINVDVSFYTAYCSEGCTGITATGIDVSNTQHYGGKRIIATDPSYIATGSTGTLTLSNGASYSITAQDRGGAIKGNRIDVLVASHAEAMALGRLSGTITLD